MKGRKHKSRWFQNNYFLSGLGVSTLLFLVTLCALYTSGYLQFRTSTEETYANSLSPRKQTSASIYSRPTPDPSNWDQIAPTISFASPVDGSNVDKSWKSGSYYVQPIKISASDNDRIMVVYLFVNDILDGINAYNSTSYEQNVRIPIKTGTYTIKAIAYDYNNNPAEVKISVIVPK